MNELKTPFSRRTLLKAGAGAAALPLLGCSGRDERPPNIVVVITDALRASSLSFHGNQRETAPFLASLLPHSTLYERCYASALWTRPAVTGILSGLSPLEHRNWKFGKSFPAGVPSFAQVLRRMYYQTGFFTANPAVGEVFDIDDHFDFVSWESAKNWEFGPALSWRFKKWAKGLREGPFCAYLHYFPPHGPYSPPPKILARLQEQGPPDSSFLQPHQRDVEISLGESALGRVPWYQAGVNFSNDPVDYLDRYEGNILLADSLLADLFEKYSSIRPDERTVFIFTSDHGESLGENGNFAGHGKLLANSILHVPLLVHDSARPERRVVSTPVSQLDLASSILQLAGSEERLGFLGRRIFAPEREPLEEDRPILSQEGHSGTESGWALTVGDWRIIYNDGPGLGNEVLLAVDAPAASRRATERVPLDRSTTATREPSPIGGGVSIDAFALHASHLEAHRSCAFSGSVRLESPRRGEVLLRMRRAGGESIELGSHPIDSDGGSFEGTVPAIAAEPGDALTPMIVEARFVEEATRPESQPWVPLITTPLLVPQRLQEDFELIGVVPRPEVACPGDSIQIEYRWKTTGEPPARKAVFVHFVSEDGEVAFRNDHHWYTVLTTSDQRLRRLLRPRRKVSYRGKSLRFDERFWVSIPEELRPGSYEIRVGLFAPGTEQGSSDREAADASVVAGRLTVVATRSLAHGELVRREAGVEQFRAPRAGIGLGESSAAASPSPGEGLPVEFGDLLRLRDFGVGRGTVERESICVTLHWDALAAGLHCYTASLKMTSTHDEGEDRVTGTRWFIGGGIYPTSRWKPGESISESVCLPVPEGARTVQFSLFVYSYWDKLYSDSRYEPRLPARAGGHKLLHDLATLGSFELSELPELTPDLLTAKREGRDFFQLYNLKEDPQERVDLVDDEPEVFKRMQAQLLTILRPLELANDRASRDGEIEQALSPETLKQLRALGYTE